MAKLRILQFPDPRLRQVAQPVTEIDKALHTLAQDMLETMYAASGIGLAATQVGIAKRLIVMDISEGRDAPEWLVNPEIVTSEGRRSMVEGCLSVPEYSDSVKRVDRLVYRGLDLDGRPVEKRCDGLLATCIQHEIDHLNGRLFIDRLSLLKAQRIRKRLKKLGQRGTPPPPQGKELPTSS